jgi:hypothetical protein
MTQVTNPIDTNVFSPEDEASLIGAAAAVAESDASKDEAIETYGRKLGKAPTLAMYVHAQNLFQKGYIQAMPDMSADALAKRTTRFSSDVLNTYGMTKPKSDDPAAEKKAEQREAEKQKILAEFKGVKPAEIKEQIKDHYAKLAASVPDSKEVKKELKKAELALKLMTAEQTEAFKKQKAALVSSLNDAVKKCEDLKKIENAIKALK